MEISDELKDNLIADVKNILDIELTPNEDSALARCFEITIGNAITKLQVNDKKEAIERCNHILGANDESGNCLKCGKKVCKVINNNLHE
jgi:hypothetical protein